MITIYTDGSSRGNPGPGGWGAVILTKDKVKEIGGREEHTTNNKMELTAAIRALELIQEPDNIQIHIDSEYVIKGITEWIHSWQKKGWKTAAKKPVLNQDYWQELLTQTNRIESAGCQIEWKHVASHVGIPLNERADIIATEFADNLNPDLYDGPKEKYQ